jgi:hypothetical protein
MYTPTTDDPDPVTIGHAPTTSPPGLPAVLTLAQTSEEAVLTWTLPTQMMLGVQSFQVWRQVAGEGDYAAVKTAIAKTATTTSLASGLNPALANTDKVKVRSLHSSGLFSDSAIVTISGLS